MFVHFERPDLGKAEQYLRDFGLVVISKSQDELALRGTGPRPYVYRVTRGPKARFVGLGLAVASAKDLETLSKRSGRPIERSNGLGGGSVVCLRDPEGIEVDVLHGYAPSEPLPTRPAIPHNAPSQIVRVNDTQRPALEPPQVTKLGHLVIETPDFEKSARWYMDTLGFIPSDVMCLPDGTPVGAFMRLDRGDEPTDFFALEGLSQLLTTVEQVRRTLNQALTIHGVVLTMYDPCNSLARQVVADVRVYGRQSLRDGHPPQCTPLRGAFARKASVAL